MPTDPTYQYTIEDIRRYLSGSMSPAEMHDMEKAALADPFLADALDGYRTARPAVADIHLNEIRSRISGQKVEPGRQTPVVALHKTKWWRGLAAAAVIGIMAAGAWFFMRPDNSTTSHIAIQDARTAPPATKATADTAAAQDDHLKDTAIAMQQLAVTGRESHTSKPLPATKKTVPPPAAPALQAAEEQIAAADAVVVPALPAKAMANLPKDSHFSANARTNNSMLRIRGVSSLKKAPSENLGAGWEGPIGATGNLSFVAAKNEEPPYYLGKVTDTSGIPIPGVTITTSQNKSTVSNVDGSFRLPAQDSAGSLAFTAPGYKYKMQQLLSGKVAGIQLTKTDNALNDVVVIGYGQQKKRAVIGSISSYKVDTLPYKESPYPQGGWDSFYNNLTNEMGINKGNASKELHLRFTVENGLPEKFTVVKTPDEATAQKAISIIKKGPKWKTSKRKKKVDVKMKVD
ncbi:carboxypeptidase regulatory-like domain-containing protein [Niabella pedocola]|uniref:Carboxypeptidase regulatory-like domain-containing protein n=1 Tax=Niabella pedocola TaxID=1752077 RepID=A0ABS8PM87_9BACT|nr:carboxypeptidase regulatory-like domain-containing protein [Niabella pedocola]MCD2422225.1 carboxypeptidase regulatory-like domain-containing protein [Niabella pedocola]